MAFGRLFLPALWLFVSAEVHRFPLKRIQRWPTSDEVIWSTKEPKVGRLDPVSNLAAKMDFKLGNMFDAFYLVELQVGTPPIPLDLILDTGSSDLWFMKASGDRAVGYNASASSTARFGRNGSNLTHVHMQYGMGVVDGLSMYEKICLQSLCLRNQSFVAAEMIRDIPGSADFDGLLGLAFPALAKDRWGPTFLEGLTGVYSNLSFSLALSSKTDESLFAVGELDDVLAEAQAVSGSQGATLPLYSYYAEATYWLVSLTIKVGSSHEAPRLSRLAVLDSGTSLIALPVEDFDPVVSSMFISGDSPNSEAPELRRFGGAIFCSCDAVLQGLTISLGQDFDQGVWGHNVEIKLSASDLLQYWGEDEGVKWCRLALMQAPAAMGSQWIVGDVFLRKVYAVHDVGNQQMVLFPRDPEQTSSWRLMAEVWGLAAVAVVSALLLLVCPCHRWFPRSHAFLLRPCRGCGRRQRGSSSGMVSQTSSGGTPYVALPQ
mmetsp:Transcript_36468/g.79815  ORF Transcript_36468/g.79815 Transcript_36468/m.79815 type:complete len:488 (+) Transcript_36468:40-1503(+)